MVNAEETERQKAKNLRCKKLWTFAGGMDHVKENERIIERIIMVTDNMVDL